MVLIMKRASLAQGLMRWMEPVDGLRLVHETDYARAGETVRARQAQAALLEVAESGECDAEYCLALCRELRAASPLCRLMLMCPENDENAVEKAVLAKREGRIDDFVFYDASMEYLATSLRALCAAARGDAMRRQ